MKILGTNLTNKGYNVSSKIGTAAINRVAVFNDTAGNIKDSGFTIESSVPANAKFTDTVYTHPTTAGNKHVPSGGSSGQLLKWSAAGTAAWSTITPADIGAAASSHTHSYIPTTASCNKNWNWSGQSGQPTWLWGGEDGTNMYVYNPQNFTVNYSHNTGKINGKNVFIQTGTPTAQTAGDLWISW